MAHPLVSFIVPVYSISGNYLSQCLDSILQLVSTYRELEILVLNDQSPDNTAQVIANYAARYPQFIRPIPSERRLGQAAARAIMVNQARGKYIIPCDHDDVVLPFDLERSIAVLERHPEYFGSYAGKFYFSDRGYEHRQDGGTFSVFRMFIAPKININVSILRREDVLAVGNFLLLNPVPGAFDDDLFLLLRMGLRKKFLFEPYYPRCLYRMHPGQITQRHGDKAGAQFPMLQNFLFTQYKETAQVIMQGKLPAITPENDRLVMALLGVFSVTTWNNFDFSFDCCKAAISLHPDDYGPWLQILHLAALHGRADVWNATYENMRECFSRDLFIQLEMGFAEQNWYRMRKMPIPQTVETRVADIYSKYLALPASVAQHPLLREKQK